MDTEKAKALSKTLESYNEIKTTNRVNMIDYHTADGQKQVICDTTAITLMISGNLIDHEC